MEYFIGYIRTSTGRQVLGVEEQKSRIQQFIQSSGDELIDIVSEQESGSNNDRIRLEYAINLCIKYGYTLLFTKPDRLSREVEFLFTLKSRGVRLRCIELPELNTMTLGIFGSLAQGERELISSRTKRGLDELRKRNVKLGSPQNLTNAAREKGVQAVIRNRFFILHFQMKNGYLKESEISKQLNFNGYRTRNGCRFSPGIVRRLVVKTAHYTTIPTINMFNKPEPIFPDCPQNHD